MRSSGAGIPTTEHPTPAFEDVGRGLRRTHGKGHWRCVDQDTQQHIPLRRLEQQLQIVPGQDQHQNQDDQCHRPVSTDADDGEQDRVEAGKSRLGSVDVNIQS